MTAEITSKLEKYLDINEYAATFEGNLNEGKFDRENDCGEIFSQVRFRWYLVIKRFIKLGVNISQWHFDIIIPRCLR